MDHASVIGILLGVAAIMIGNMIDGGRIDTILQPTAALVVFGGTLGATLLSVPFRDMTKAAESFFRVFFYRGIDPEEIIRDVLRYAIMARRNGLIVLESEITRITNPLLAKALKLAVDGTSPAMLREIMQQENMTYEEERRKIARVYETAGGFAPTIGIIGAVLGLIHVMDNITDPSKLGTGIAIAFVATIYGVGSANLFLLPVSKKLINILHRDLAMREMILEAVLGIQSGMNPHYLEERLRVFVEHCG
ncbi:MAG: flagellar motor protein [Nitrospirota bacterium]